MTFLILSGAFFVPAQGAAAEACKIHTDISHVYAVRERSVPLSEYKSADYPPVFIRAASGTVLCEEEVENIRFLCQVSGKGEIFVEGGDTAARVIEFKTEVPGLAHIYPSGDISCGAASDFN
ncbi:hypothetical protein [Pseudophaeobacter sp.]|uniref:hypothetical protein n=1 Tax=Pseudophaeobacter sp. TaxID=1971739 RepID=UPI00329706D5